MVVETLRALNWRRGLFRMWVVMTVAWFCLAIGIAAMTWPPDPPLSDEMKPTPQGTMTDKPWEMVWSAADADSCSNARANNPKLGNPFECFPTSRPREKPPTTQEKVIRTATLLGYIWLLPCLAVLMIGLLGEWALRGFARS